MGIALGTLLELRMEAGGFSAKIDCPKALHPSPGQYLLASCPDAADVLPTALFRYLAARRGSLGRSPAPLPVGR